MKVLREYVFVLEWCVFEVSEFDEYDSLVCYVFIVNDENEFIVIGCLIKWGELGWIVVKCCYRILFVYCVLFEVLINMVK